MQELVSLEHALAVVTMRIMGERLGAVADDTARNEEMVNLMQALKRAWPNEMEAARRGTQFIPGGLRGGVRAVWDEARAAQR